MASNPIPREALERNIEAAEQATPGPWHAPGLGELHSDHDNGVWVGLDTDGEQTPIIADWCTVESGDENAEFIVRAADPLSGLAALSRRVMELEEERASVIATMLPELAHQGEPLAEAVQEYGRRVGWVKALSADEQADRHVCETCRFAARQTHNAGDLMTAHSTYDADIRGSRWCVVLQKSVPVTINGEPFGCRGWQAKETT